MTPDKNCAVLGRASMIKGIALGLLSILTMGQALAQGTTDVDAKNYPNRPIRILVPFPPGGPADLIARFVGQKMTEDFGQPVVIENRAGGNTVIGAQAVHARRPTATRCSPRWTPRW